MANKLEKMQLDFSWGGSVEEFKFHSVDENVVCSPLNFGGLGIWKLSNFNRALLGNGLWPFVWKRDHLWERVIVIKYGESWG